jgi:hypothetical protein
MIVDSDSTIAWHRTQLKKHRETLKDLEIARFTVGEIAGSKSIGQTQKIIADLKRKIRQSEQIIAAHEKQTRRPRATDHQSLANVRWSSWNARSNGAR